MKHKENLTLHQKSLTVGLYSVHLFYCASLWYEGHVKVDKSAVRHGLISQCISLVKDTRIVISFRIALFAASSPAMSL